MKRLLSCIILLVFCFATGICGINKTLNAAQSLYQSATTISEYQNAKKKFQSAKSDVGYVAAEHDKAINEGIRKCDKKINELSPRLTVNGSSSSTNIAFSASGGTQTLSISTNQGTPTASALPSWITVSNSSSSSMTITCSTNSNSSTRNDWFQVNAGGKSVRVNVSQGAAENRTIQFTSSSFGNTKKDNTVIDSYGSSLYASSIQYLCWRISYNGPSSSQTKQCYIKYIKPDGSLMTGSSSPEGYTTSKNITFSPGSNTVEAAGWGNENGTAYNAGTYRCELWFDGRKQYSASITLQKKQGEASYLTVDNKTAVSTSFSGSGGNETFYVSTDADSWTTWGIPSWCRVTDKTSTSFKLVCEANTSSSSRSDYMKIKAGDKEVRIDISQNPKPGPTATIENVWVDHNAWNGMVKGMKIHIKLRIAGYKGRTVKYCVFFYQSDNTTKLVNMYGNHISQSATSTSDYDDCTWNDWWIFVPYTNIFGARNATGRYSFDVEIQKTDGSLMTRNENNQFYQY